LCSPSSSHLIALIALIARYPICADYEVRTTPLLYTTPGCCRCESHSMPEFFSDESVNPGFPDNKHVFLQTTITGIANELRLTVALELIHGQYYRDFEELYNRGDLYVFTPNRALIGSTDSFLSLLSAEALEEFGIELPLNMPQQTQRLPGTQTYAQTFEDYVLIDRPSAIEIGDAGCCANSPQYVPSYVTRRYRMAAQPKSLDNATSGSGDDDDEGAEVDYGDGRAFLEPPFYSAQFLSDKEQENWPDDPYGQKPWRGGEGLLNHAEKIGDPASALYAIPDDPDVVTVPDNWWDAGPIPSDDNPVYETGPNNPFVYMPYFPFFSNCRGYDSHISIAKFLETHPDCNNENVRYGEVVPTEKYPEGTNMLNWISRSDRCRYDFEGRTGDGSLNRRGAILECEFEEDVQLASGNARWFEAPAESELFYLTRFPFVANLDDWCERC